MPKKVLGIKTYRKGKEEDEVSNKMGTSVLCALTNYYSQVVYER